MKAAKLLQKIQGRKTWRGRMACAEDVKHLLRAGERANRANGQLLASLVPSAIPEAAGAAMRAAVLPHIGKNYNRGVASGQKKEYPILKDGTRSRTTRCPEAVESAAMGFFDRSYRFPYCRMAPLGGRGAAVLAASAPAIRAADAAFARGAPEAYARQRAAADRTHPAYRIAGSVFTTITMNRNFRTAYHKDSGDLPEGFGVMTCLRRGVWDGAELVFPEWGLAVRMGHGDVLLFDPHELHGNLPLRLRSAEAERMTFVHYFRRNMPLCGAPADELHAAQRHHPRDGLRAIKKNLSLAEEVR